MTIFEIMLVLVIASTILVMGFRQYQAYQVEQQLNALKYNINLIFQAMTNYYQANCIQNKNYSDDKPLTAGKLDPINSPPDYYPIKLQQDLRIPGYLAQNLIYIPIVDSPPTFNTGYILQFNKHTPSRQAELGDGTLRNVGTIYLWKEQVAVKLHTSDPNKMTAYKNIVGANCISDVMEAGIVIPCSEQQPVDGSYLVWERLPSFSLPDALPSTWPGVPTLKQFNLQYTHDMIDEINNPLSKAYYLCGG